MASHYEALDVHPQSSVDDIRRAYHRAARQHHPDKRSSATTTTVTSSAADDATVTRAEVSAPPDEKPVVGDDVNAHRFLRIQEAYETLRDPEKRAQYDSKLARDEIVRKRDGDDVRIADEVRVADMAKEVIPDETGDEADEVVYSHQCRCGDVYEITEDELLDGIDVAPCNGCSLNIRVLMHSP